jgi:hypothetical protein
MTMLATRSLTTTELAEQSGYSVRLVERLLVEEVERGHVRRVGAHSWDAAAEAPLSLRAHVP